MPSRLRPLHPRHPTSSSRGDQVHAVPELVDGLNRGDKHQVLLGVTGSGKTFTMAQVIARVNRPTLVMAHNKTLAAQLFQEFRRFFPDNAVEYFVSYYDYYQPEAYVPASDTYIEKESTINDEIDRMRLSATRSLFERRDVIIVASVSLHLRPGLARGLLRPGAAAREGAAHRRATRSCASWSRSSTSATTTSSGAAPSASAATSSRSTRPTKRSALRIGLFGDEVDELAIVRSAHRQGAAPARAHRRLSEVALRHQPRPPEGRGRDDQGRAGRAPRLPRARGQGARGAAAAPAHDVRPRDDQGDRLLPRHRELLAPPDRPQRRASRRRRCSTTCRRTR